MNVFFRYAAALALAGFTPLAAAQVRITEYMYDGPSKEFVEITNVGATSVDLSGWSYDDDSNAPDSVPIGALGTLAPGESAIIAENTADAFRAAWGLCAAAKVLGGSTHNLGRADTINLYDANDVRVDTLRYGDQAFPGTIRTQNASGWVSAAGLGNDQIAQWTLSSVGDAENSRLSSAGEIGSPGLSTRAASPYNPCQPLGPRMRITEYMYDSSANGEFVEFTNVGDAPADMAGWSFDDDSNAPGTVSLGAFGTVQPGESVLFTDQAATAFRTAWGLCAGVKVIGGNTVGLGRNDVINLYDATNVQIDKLAYGDQNFPGSIRTTGASGWVSAAGLGANLPLEWTLATVGDAEGSRAATGGAIGSPGASTRALFDYDACVGVGGSPEVTVDVGATTRRLDLAVNGAGAVAATIGDATDPAATDGIVFHFADTDGDVSALTVIATSSNAAVVADGGLTWTGSGADRTLRIAPAGAAGYAAITVRATDAQSQSGTYTINYAASLGGAPADRNHTGVSDASTAIDVGGAHMIVADDENQNLRLYSRIRSGLAENGFDYTSSLALPDIDGGVPREVDIEGAASDGSTIWWTGSHSNKKDNGASRPNRQRVFATTLTGTGDAAQLAYVGRYDHLRTDLVAWDANNGHGLGANALGLAASAAIGVWPERDDGFNIEGLALAPDADGLYAAFRAPLLPTSARTKALVIHATNLRALVVNAPAGGSQPAGSVTFAAPIELDLGGRGIREITRTSDGQYLIVAGPTASATGTPPSNFQLYLWSGNAANAPLPLNANLAAVAAAGSVETLVGTANAGTNVLTFLSDSGDTVWYNDGIVAKDLPEPRIRKFVGVDLTVDVPPAGDVIFRSGFD